MSLRRGKPRYKHYKFYQANLWGKIFCSKKFREKDVFLAKLNRRMTLRALDVNPVKLASKTIVCRRSWYSLQAVVEEILF